MIITKEQIICYGRFNAFLQSHQINENIGTSDFRHNQINCLREYLANSKNNGDFGLFNVIPFTIENWIYVGKVFSQCVFPPKFLNRLPELFESIGFVPDIFYEDRFAKFAYRLRLIGSAKNNPIRTPGRDPLVAPMNDRPGNYDLVR